MILSWIFSSSAEEVKEVEEVEEEEEVKEEEVEVLTLTLVARSVPELGVFSFTSSTSFTPSTSAR